MGRIEGKVVLVTGGTADIGRAIAVALAREGARIVVTGRSRNGSEVTLAAIRAAGGEAQSIAQDVTREEEWASTINTVLDRHQRLDGLVNSAGVRILKPVEQMTADEFRQMLRTNAEAVFLGLKHAVPAMEKNGGGSVVTIGAIAAIRGTAEALAYSCSKGAAMGLGRAAALEGRATKIRVNAVHPGFVYSAGTVLAFGEDGARKAREAAAARTPLARAGAAEDIASIVVYLLSDESRHVTGSDFVVDGGLIAV